MGQFRIEIRKGGTIVGSWRLGDESLELSIYDGDEKTLDLTLSDPRQKSKTNLSSAIDDFTLPLPENIERVSMEISENDRDTEEAENHFLRHRQNQYIEQEQAFKAYSAKYAESRDDSDGSSWDSVSEADDATVPLSKSELLRRSQSRRPIADAHFDDSDYEYHAGTFDDFSLPAIIEPTFDGVPELQDDLQNEGDQLRSSLFSSLKEDSNLSIDPPSMESLPIVEAEYSDVFRSLLLDDYPSNEDSQGASSLEALEISEELPSEGSPLLSLEVWSFDGDAWEMLGELPPGEQTVVFDLTVRHHRSGKMTVQGFSEVAVMLIDDNGQEHLYTPGLDEPISSGGTVLLRKDDQKSICIRPPE